MLLTKKKPGDGIPFARKEAYEYDGTQYEADIKIGDIIKILDSGKVEDGEFGSQNNFKIKTRNGEKKISPNQSTINVLVEEFGEDTENWVGKEVRVLLKKCVIAGKKRIASYFVTEGWELDEYGELVDTDIGEKITADQGASIQKGDDPNKSELVQTPANVEEVKVEDIPF